MMKPYIIPDLTNAIVLLTMALVLNVTFAVGATGWTEGLNIVIFVGLGTIIISLMLVRSTLSGLVAHPMSIIIGLAWSFWVTSRLLPIHYTWLDRWQNLADRLASWYLQASQGGTSYDNLMFIYQMSLIIWGMGYMTIWLMLHSGRVWQAIIPGGLVILINLYYAPIDITFWFIIYLMLGLLLVLRFNLAEQEARWRSEGTMFRADISIDVLRDGFIFTALVMIFAWFTPPLVEAKSLTMFDEFQGSWQDLQREWNRMYANLNYRNPTSLETFGTSLTLGGARLLTNDPVMEVKVNGLGSYWRAAVYDEYNGAGWLTHDDSTASFGPQTKLSLPIYQARYAVTQTFTYYRDGATVLYAMSNPVWLDRNAKVTFNALSDDLVLPRKTAPVWSFTTSRPWVEEITYMRSNTLVNQGESYQVVSQVSQATEQQLAASGTNYPTWVKERYLQLPDSLTPRTQTLAHQVTATVNNNYAKAQAIEAYLRNSIKYNEKIAQPPDGVDKVDYILFETQEAYCDYYASAMIVMLRSMGIPARFAVGFARGQFNSTTGTYHVINADAHSWVEVYFPEYGWIEFEPTASQPLIPRLSSTENEGDSSSTVPEQARENEEDPVGPNNIPIDDESILLDSTGFQFQLPIFNQSIQLSRSFLITSVVMLFLILVWGSIGGLVWWQKQQNGSNVESIFKIYLRMVRFGHWVGVIHQAWQTPYEHTGLLKERLHGHERELDIITTEYVQQTYRPTTIQAETAAFIASHEAQQAWETLRQAMQTAIIKRFVPRWFIKQKRA